jgi:putative endonuclease
MDNYCSDGARDIGAAAERAAEQWLKRRGLSTISRNYRCRRGEIDLVMRDAGTLVFVEVRLRSRSSFGSAEESVTVRKQRRLVMAARQFIATHPQLRHLSCRFDVLAATGRGAVQDWQWLRNAFDAGD